MDATRMNSIERSMERFLVEEKMPSLSFIAAWLKRPTKLKPTDLAAKIAKALAVPDKHRRVLAACGDIRNVLSHLTEYEANQASIGAARKYLSVEPTSSSSGRVFDISKRKYLELESVCMDILSKRGVALSTDVCIPPKNR